MSTVQELKSEIKKLKGQISDLNASKSNGTFINLPNQPSSNFQQPKMRRELKGHFGKVYAMHWANSQQTAEQGSNLVSASQDGKLIVWNAMTTFKIQAIPLRSSWVMTCAYEPTLGEKVACGGLDNLCSVYDLKSSQGTASSNRAWKELAAHDGYLSCCRFIDNAQIITSSGDSTCILWDVEKGEAITHCTDHGGDVMSVAIRSTNPHTFVSGSCDATAKLWDTRMPGAANCVMTYDGHESDINSVDFMANGMAFGTGSDDSSCRLYDLRSHNCLNHFSNEKILCGITSVSFSGSGRLLFAGYDNYNCYGWDCLKGGISTEDAADPIAQLQGHENRVSCIGVNCTGMALATGSWDTILKIWA